MGCPVTGREAGLLTASCQKLEDEGWAACLFWQLSKGSLLLNRDGLANAGFVWEEVCVSEELDALVNKGALTWGHLRSILKPVLASPQRTEARGGS